MALFLVLLIMEKNFEVFECAKLIYFSEKTIFITSFVEIITGVMLKN
jgi:hypothetical protein